MIGIFMFNPCHVVVSVYSYLLLTPKTRNTSVLYICITRWLYGTYLVKFKYHTIGLGFPFFGGARRIGNKTLLL